MVYCWDEYTVSLLFIVPTTNQKRLGRHALPVYRAMIYESRLSYPFKEFYNPDVSKAFFLWA
jgi:hypothetical protein